MFTRTFGKKLDHFLLLGGVPLCAIALGFLCITLGSRDSAALLLFVCLAPVLFITIFFLAIKKKGIYRLEAIFLLVVLFGSVCLVEKNFMGIRIRARWAINSASLKERVVSDSDSGEYLRHTQWDEWGFAGVGNGVEYIVFDPKESLSSKANGDTYRQIKGIPCGPAQVWPLESHWYVVRLWIDGDWNHCHS